MADVVLTVAKTLVEGTLSKAQTAIEDEEKLRKRAQRDLVFIAGEFQMMQSFLKTADWEQVKNTVGEDLGEAGQEHSGGGPG